jgi:hypothetical protein
MINTISDIELEREYITSKFLSKIIWPKDYISLRFLISNIKILDTKEIIPLTYPPLKLLITNQGLLKDKVIEGYYYGKESILLELFMLLLGEVSMNIPIYEQKIAEKLEEIQNDIESQLPGEGYEGIGYIINTTLNKNEEVKNFDSIKFDLQKLKAQLENIIIRFGSGIEKISHKDKKVSFDVEYQLYLLNLQNKIDKFTDDGALAGIIAKAIDAIGIMNPKNSLDPFVKDLEDNLIHVLTKPDNFYSDCKNDNIVSKFIGQAFGLVYPHFFKKFYSIYLDEYEKLSYQEQMQFRNCFGISEDNSALITLCSNYVNKNFNPQGG